ncbi:hypothetical protein NDI37_27080, partial [Funiculus sociatus GB2-A5]
MELNEFLKHWDVSREDVAFICECSLTTINHWFSQGSDRTTPSVAEFGYNFQKFKTSLRCSSDSFIPAFSNAAFFYSLICP